MTTHLRKWPGEGGREDELAHDGEDGEVPAGDVERERRPARVPAEGVEVVRDARHGEPPANAFHP